MQLGLESKGEVWFGNILYIVGILVLIWLPKNNTNLPCLTGKKQNQSKLKEVNGVPENHTKIFD